MKPEVSDLHIKKLSDDSKVFSFDCDLDDITSFPRADAMNIIISNFAKKQSPPILEPGGNCVHLCVANYFNPFIQTQGIHQM